IRSEHQRNPVIACLPWIKEQFSARCFKVPRVLVAQEVQSLSQRRAPTLVPSRLSTGVTTTIANPTTDAMQTTPGSSFALRAIVNPNFVCLRMLVKILRVVRNPKASGRRLNFQRLRQAYGAKLEVAGVRRAVIRCVDQLAGAQ